MKKRNSRDFRKYEEIACTTLDDCERIKLHLKSVFCDMNLNIRIIYAYADRYRLYVSLNAFEYKLLTSYLVNANLGSVTIWNY